MRRVFVYLLIFLSLAVVLAPTPLFFPFQVVIGVVFGWIFFLVRVVPATAVNWGGVATALVCLTLIATLGHRFAAWLIGQIAPGRLWRQRWTAGLLGAVVLMFVAGIAAAGMAHQAGWLLTMREPWVVYGSGLIERLQSASQLRQIGLALQIYQESNGSLPPATTTDSTGRLMQGWQARVLPFLDQVRPSRMIQLDRAWDDPANADAIKMPVQTYQNLRVHRLHPDLPTNLSHYAGNAWVLGGERAWRRDEISDGLAHTILVGEAAGDYRPWADPQNWRDPKLGINRSPAGFGSPFVGGANFLFADGSVKFLQDTIDQRVFEALCTPNSREQVRPEDY